MNLYFRVSILPYTAVYNSVARQEDLGIGLDKRLTVAEGDGCTTRPPNIFMKHLQPFVERGCIRGVVNHAVHGQLDSIS